ncbi:MAG: ATP-dependent Clp protease proteolytic subunit [Leptolyngbya sp.]|nr:ATP-dependent Clp protease proteolytic subunit [Candidatus Melainabacteria bacterium]
MENNTSNIAKDAPPDVKSDTTADGNVNSVKTQTPEEYRKSLELRKLEIEVAKGEMDLDNLYRRAADSDASGAFVYNFFQPVRESSVAECIETLSKWSRLAPGAPFTLIINTPGGLVKEGLALFDYLTILRLAGHRITTVALGRAASMGSVLLQAGDRRLIGPNAFVLLHEVSSGTAGKQSENEESVAFTARLQDKLIAILSSRSKLTVKQLKARWKKTDLWLDAEESVRDGFADSILGSDPTDADYVRWAQPVRRRENDEDEGEGNNG